MNYGFLFLFRNEKMYLSFSKHTEEVKTLCLIFRGN